MNIEIDYVKENLSIIDNKNLQILINAQFLTLSLNLRFKHTCYKKHPKANNRVQQSMLFLTNQFMIASFIMINYFAFLKKKILDIAVVDDEEVGWLVPLL